MQMIDHFLAKRNLYLNIFYPPCSKSISAPLSVDQYIGRSLVQYPISACF